MGTAPRRQDIERIIVELDILRRTWIRQGNMSAQAYAKSMDSLLGAKTAPQSDTTPLRQPLAMPYDGAW